MAPKGGKVNTAKAGKVLVIVGLGLAAVGGTFALASTVEMKGSDGPAYSDAFMVMGLSIMAVGGVCTVIGIPLWAASPKK
jgi:hypothetical protein